MEKQELMEELTKKAQEYLVQIGRSEAKPDDGWDHDVVWVEDDAVGRAARMEGDSPPFPPHQGLAYVVLVRDHRHGGLLIRAKQDEHGAWVLETNPETQPGK